MGLPGGSVVRNPPAMQETQVWCLGWEDPLEERMEIHSNILAWRTPWTEEHGKESDTTEVTKHAHTCVCVCVCVCIAESLYSTFTLHQKLTQQCKPTVLQQKFLKSNPRIPCHQQWLTMRRCLTSLAIRLWQTKSTRHFYYHIIITNYAVYEYSCVCHQCTCTHNFIGN